MVEPGACDLSQFWTNCFEVGGQLCSRVFTTVPPRVSNLQGLAGLPDTSQSRIDSNLVGPAALQQQSRKQQRLMLGAGDLGLLTGPGRLQRSSLYWSNNQAAAPAALSS